MSGVKNESDVPESVLRQVRVSLLRTLSARFPGTAQTVDLGGPIQAETDLPTLLRWYEIIAVAGSLADVQAALVPSAPEASRPERAFFENRGKFPRGQLLAYAGQYIAWSQDASNIVASDPDEAALYRKLQAAGIDVGRVVIDYAGDGDVSYL